MSNFSIGQWGYHVPARGDVRRSSTGASGHFQCVMEHAAMPLKHIFLVTLMALIWGVQAVILKIGLGQFPPIFMVDMRFSLMTVLLAPFLSGIRGKLGQPCW